jgi:3-oxoadipate enol-lactonase
LPSPPILYHDDRGPRDGAPVLLAGSLGTTHRMWDPQVAALTAAGHRTIAYDQRGHGASPVPPGPYAIADLGRDALALLDHLGLERAAFVGLSIGGMVGQWLAANAPERVTRLVLLCTTARFPSPDPWRERAETVVRAGSVGVVADAVVGRWLTSGYAAAHPDVVAGFKAMMSAQPPDGYAACCEALATLDERADLARIEAPTLVIGGAQDAAIPTAHQRALAAAIPGARLELLDPGAHVVSAERAEDVSRLILHHLDQEAP